MKKFVKGVSLCFVIALVCYRLGKIFPIVGGPVFAILAGMGITQILKDKTELQPGIQFTSKYILQIAVVLLGFGLNLSEIAKVGAMSLPIIVVTIATALAVAYLLQKILQMPGHISTLIGVGSSICGGSAIAATAPVIGAKSEEIAQSISVIFLFNVLAALIFPTLGTAIGLSDMGFGLFAGTAVNDTSSVTAAAAAWDGLHPSANTLDAATIVKLTRTLAIIPITFVLALYTASKQKGASDQKFSLAKAFPKFILFFLLASVITTVLTAQGVDASIFKSLQTLSKFFIVMAMAAIGLNTNIVKIIKSGGKAIIMGAACWVSIAGVSLFMQRVMGIW